MGEETKKKDKKCFIITPIGNENSDIFRKAKGVIESVIKPVLEENGFGDIKPAYEIMESGMISNQIINRIINDDLVVANLTGNNPNVMYELAIRHAATKPIIHICENGTTLPFDIKDNRTIFYTDDMLGVQELRNGFEKFVKQVDYSKEYKDNPIYNAMQTGILLKELNDEDRKTEAEILAKILDEISHLKTSQHNKLMRYMNPAMGLYDMYIECNCTKENFRKFEKELSKDVQALPKYDKNENVIAFALYNTEFIDMRQMYKLILDIGSECGLKDIKLVDQKRLDLN